MANKDEKQARVYEKIAKLATDPKDRQALQDAAAHVRQHGMPAQPK